MKYFLVLVQGLMLFFSASTWAAADSQNCEAKSQQMHGAAKDSFLKSCLAQTSSPESVQAASMQEKRNTCEQNSKNMKLEGSKKSDYVNGCMNQNVAANEARKMGVKEAVASKPEHTQHTRIAANNAQANAVKKTSNKPVSSKKSCLKQAKQEGLKGEARKKFMSDCRKA